MPPSGMESDWLWERLQEVVHPSATSDEVVVATPAPEDLQRLIDGNNFSAKFILTYHIVIAWIILILTIAHWIQKALRLRRRRDLNLYASFDDSLQTKPNLNGNDEAEASSSGSSTIEGTSSPPRKDVAEETPLLLQAPVTHRSLLSTIKSFLMYQPPPIPVVHKVLPSVGSTILLLSFVLLNIFYTFFHINFRLVELAVLATRASLVFVANLPLLYLLAAKNQPLKLLTGCSYETLNIFHRRLGEILCAVALLHGAGMIGVWYTLLRPNGFTLGHLLTLPVIWLGIATLVSYETLYFTSLASFRQRWYEWFLGIHVVFQVAALILLFFHTHLLESRIYIGIALLIVSVDRLVYRIRLRSVTVDANLLVMPDGETVKLSTRIIRRPGVVWQFMFDRTIQKGWLPTDHVFITVPSLGSKHIIQAHPFTISSPAPPTGTDNMELVLIIRAMDGFTTDLLRKARHFQSHNIPPTIAVRIDGPYGSSHARDMLEHSELALVVAGGSGIAVAWPLIYHLLSLTRSSDTEVASPRILTSQRIVLIWVVHKASQLSWIGQPALQEIQNVGVQVIIPGPTEEVGRPDIRDLIRGLSRDVRGRMAVVASGPDGMGRSVRNACAELVGEGKDVDVTIEKFGW